MSSYNRVPILMYHSIMDNDEQSVSVQSFTKQMNLMKAMGYQTIRFNELKDDNKKKCPLIDSLSIWFEISFKK